MDTDVVKNQAFCPKCGNPSLLEFTSEGTSQPKECIFCQAKKQCTKPPINLEDAKIEQSVVQNVRVKSSSLENIIKMFDSLPMPKSQKQYKLILKAKKALEQALMEERTCQQI